MKSVALCYETDCKFMYSEISASSETIGNFEINYFETTNKNLYGFEVDYF
jgi:hypothetical protein